MIIGGAYQELLEGPLKGDEEKIEEFLKSLGIVGVDIESIEANMVDNRVDLRFYAIVNPKKLLENVLDEETMKSAIYIFDTVNTFLKEAEIEFLAVPEGCYRYFKVLIKAQSVYRFLYTLPKLYKVIKNGGVLKELLEFLTVLDMDSVLEQLKPLIDAINEFNSRELVFVEPVRAYIYIDNERGYLEYKTPRIVRRYAESASDTLAEIYSLVEHIMEKYSCPACDNSLAGIELEVDPVDVKVTLNGKEVKTVRFSDLPKLEVVPLKPAVTPPRSVAMHSSTPPAICIDFRCIGAVAVLVILGGVLLVKRKTG